MDKLNKFTALAIILIGAAILISTFVVSCDYSDLDEVYEYEQMDTLSTRSAADTTITDSLKVKPSVSDWQEVDAGHVTFGI